MSSRTIAVFTEQSASVITKLKLLLPSVQFLEVKPSDPSQLKKADIILGDYDLVGPYLYDLPKLTWFQGTWAGVDALWPHIKKDSPPEFPITRLSGLGRLMGEYVFANIVFCERNYFKVKENQHQKVWDSTICPNDHRSISDLKIGILGIGSIGNIIGQTLNYLGATIYGFGRRDKIPLDSEEYRHIERYYNKSTLAELLKEVHYVVNVLPKTAETNNLLGNEILKNCKDAVFINIGRGNIINEDELVEALKKRWISGAILDVFETEPLPKTSELWNLPNVFLTPHIAGCSRPQDIAQRFKENFERFANNKPLINQIDFAKEY